MKINLAVLFGGKTVEHEISVITALQAVYSLDRGKYNIIPVYITKKGEFFTGDVLLDIENFRDIPAMLKQCRAVTFLQKDGRTYIYPVNSGFFSRLAPIALIDVAFPIVHGTNVEDGALQGYLKTLGLPFVGCDVLASAVCMDKYTMKIMLKEAGIPVLDCLRFSAFEHDDHNVIAEMTEAKFPYPVIVKPVNLGSSVGIGKAGDRDALLAAINTAFTFAERIIIEPAVQNLREINCAVLGDAREAVPSVCEEPIAADVILSYSDKYLSGGKNNGKIGSKADGKNIGSKTGGSKGMASLSRKIPADIPADIREHIEHIAVTAFQTLDCCGVARIDFLMDGVTNEVWLNELNTIPGSLAFYLWEAAGMKYAELLDRMIKLAISRKQREDEIVYSFDTNILSSGVSFGSKG
jgi:D-alanine-D-alanine ligase